MAEIVGTASAVYALLAAAKELLKHIHYLRHNAPHKLRLQTLAQDLIDMLQSAETAWPSASALTLQELQSVLLSMQSFTLRHQTGVVNRVLSCLIASKKHSMLEEAERKLESLRTQVVVIDRILQLVRTICNERVDLPSSDIGLNRSVAVMEFLRMSELEEVRVIGIHGLPGIGKTTLLNHVWQEVSSKLPFTARAYVQIGNDANPYMIGRAQGRILWQLGDKNMEFPSPEIGRGQLSQHFEKLREERKPLFLAIDNVIEARDLEMLLPSKLTTGNLPSSTCIAVTCRNYRVVKALLNMCHLQEHNQSQVFCFEPPCLTIEESKRVFADCAAIQHTGPEHRELLDALVPMCGGLPLALTVLGRIFVDEGRREKEEWKLIQKQMATLDFDNEDTSAVTKSLQLSYERLAPSRQDAFLDMVSTFYGWPWETVERIVGKSVMRDLRNSSLISEAEGIDKCNQSALRDGYHSDYWFGGLYSEKRVAMHDLTLRFGESILHADALAYTHSKENSLEDLFPKASKIRNLRLSYHTATPQLLEFLNRATNLQMLTVSSCARDLNFVATFGKTEPAQKELRYLTMRCPLTSTLLENVKVSSGIVDFTLDKCEDINTMPGDFPNMERLRICNCTDFWGFSRLEVRGWQDLKDLVLINCGALWSIPAELGRLPNLRAVFVGWCGALAAFPALTRSRGGLSSVVIRYCSRLENVGGIYCPLRKLEVEGLPIRSLDPLLQDVASLTSLSVAWCENLKELPATLENASSLEKLEVIGCRNLTELLPGNDIDKLHLLTSSLKELKIAGCPNLKAAVLPAGVHIDPCAKHASYSDLFIVHV